MHNYACMCIGLYESVYNMHDCIWMQGYATNDGFRVTFSDLDDIKDHNLHEQLRKSANGFYYGLLLYMK